jgi:hypothetical protein
MENLNLLILGFHITPMMVANIYASPTSMLMARACHKDIVPSVTVIFFDALDRQFLYVENSYIGMHRDLRHPHLSPKDFNEGEFMFGNMLHLTMTPSTHIMSTIFHRMTGYILPNIENQIYIHGFERPPWVMQYFDIDTQA